MSSSHLDNMETAVRPVLALGLFAMRPFLAVGAAACLGYIVLTGAYGAAAVPFATTDERIDELLTHHFTAGKVLAGAIVLLTLGVLGYAGVMLAKGRWSRHLLPKAAAVAAIGYAGLVTVGGNVHGTHPWGQLAHSWAAPKSSALMAWNCPASLAEGSAAREGRYNLANCQDHVDRGAMDAACRQVMRRMAALTPEQQPCYGAIRRMTGYTWPNWAPEIDVTQGWVRKPADDAKRATPENMRAILAGQGLTPL